MPGGIGSTGQNKRNQIIFFAVGLTLIIGSIMGALIIGDKRAGRNEKVVEDTSDKLVKKYNVKPSRTLTPRELWIEKSEKEFGRIQQENTKLREDLSAIMKKLEAIEKKQLEAPDPSGAPIIAPVAPSEGPGGPSSSRQMTPQEREEAESFAQSLIDSQLPPPPKPPKMGAGEKDKTPPGVTPGVAPGAAHGQVAMEKKIFEVDLSPTVDKKKEQAQKLKKNIETYLPIGALSKAVLLNGIDAPTGGLAQSNPLPVLMRLKDNGFLPNFARSAINNCHVIGAASGNLSSERVEIRLENLSCVLISGDVVEVAVRGFVAGEDGKAGLRGRVVSKQGAVIARSMFAGILSGMGSSLEEQYTQTSISALGAVSTVDPGRAFEAGLAKGFGSTMEKVADFYLQRANELYPIIEIDAKRIGDIILTGGSDMGQPIAGRTKQKP